jgi:hypothetical protein
MHAPRFSPVGSDMDGRLYYILSPQKVKKLPAEGERDNLRRWAWFVAVWGTPLEDDEDEDRSERWFGISDPTEIKHTSKWLMARALHDEYDAATGKSSSKGRAKNKQQERRPSPDPLRMTSPLSVLSDSPTPTALPDTTTSDREEDAMSDLSSLTDDEDNEMDVDGEDQRERERVQQSIDQQMARYYGPRPPMAQLKAMCKQMDEFADFLSWRLAKESR